jgi:hypothetical protein
MTSGRTAAEIAEKRNERYERANDTPGIERIRISKSTFQSSLGVFADGLAPVERASGTISNLYLACAPALHRTPAFYPSLCGWSNLMV